MKMYTFANEAWSRLKERFLRTLKDDYEVTVIDGKFPETIYWATPSASIVKAEIVRDTVKGNIGERIIFSDIDIQFFRIFAGPTIEQKLEQMDKILGMWGS